MVMFFSAPSLYPRVSQYPKASQGFVQPAAPQFQGKKEQQPATQKSIDWESLESVLNATSLKGLTQEQLNVWKQLPDKTRLKFFKALNQAITIKNPKKDEPALFEAREKYLQNIEKVHLIATQLFTHLTDDEKRRIFWGTPVTSGLHVTWLSLLPNWEAQKSGFKHIVNNGQGRDDIALGKWASQLPPEKRQEIVSLIPLNWISIDAFLQNRSTLDAQSERRLYDRLLKVGKEETDPYSKQILLRLAVMTVLPKIQDEDAYFECWKQALTIEDTVETERGGAIQSVHQAALEDLMQAEAFDFKPVFSPAFYEKALQYMVEHYPKEAPMVAAAIMTGLPSESRFAAFTLAMHQEEAEYAYNNPYRNLTAQQRENRRQEVVAFESAWTPHERAHWRALTSIAALPLEHQFDAFLLAIRNSPEMVENIVQGFSPAMVKRIMSASKGQYGKIAQDIHAASQREYTFEVPVFFHKGGFSIDFIQKTVPWLKAVLSIDDERLTNFIAKLPQEHQLDTFLWVISNSPLMVLSIITGFDDEMKRTIRSASKEEYGKIAEHIHEASQGKNASIPSFLKKGEFSREFIQKTVPWLRALMNLDPAQVLELMPKIRDEVERFQRLNREVKIVLHNLNLTQTGG